MGYLHPDAAWLSLSGRHHGLVDAEGLVTALSNTMDAEFCIEALEEALMRFGRPDDLQHRQFQGSQFTSPMASPAMLETAGVRISMDRRGRWMGNVFIERLWRQPEIRMRIPACVRDRLRLRRADVSESTTIMPGARILCWPEAHRQTPYWAPRSSKKLAAYNSRTELVSEKIWTKSSGPMHRQVRPDAELEDETFCRRH